MFPTIQIETSTLTKNDPKESPILPRESPIGSDSLPTVTETSLQQDVGLMRVRLLPVTTTTSPLPALQNQLETLFPSISKARPKSKPFSNPRKPPVASNWQKL